MQKKNETLMKRYIAISEQERNQLSDWETVATRKEAIIKLKESTAAENAKEEELNAEYARLLVREKIIADKIKLLTSKKKFVQEEILETMHRWLLNHQSYSTGLIKSFEGNVGVVENWAFIYDQALAVNVFFVVR